MALDRVQRWTAAAGLQLHPDKTQIVDADQQGFDFLGYHFRRRKRWPNAFFAEHGLFGMEAAHALARQSARR